MSFFLIMLQVAAPMDVCNVVSKVLEPISDSSMACYSNNNLHPETLTSNSTDVKPIPNFHISNMSNCTIAINIGVNK